MHLIVNFPRNSKIALKFWKAKRFLSYESDSQNVVWINNSNRLAYLNFDAMFEYFGQFTIRCMYYY